MVAFSKPSRERTHPRSNAVQFRSRPSGRLDLSGYTTFPFHRSGWRYAVESLKPLHNMEGARFVGLVEQEFGWSVKANVDTGILPLTRPWIGVFHNPPTIPAFCGSCCSPEAILNSFYFCESLPYCRGIITLSEYLRDWLTRRLEVPVVSLVHPTEPAEKQFSMERFLENHDKSVVQVGAWLRRFQSLKHLPLTEYRKICLDTGETGRGYQELEEGFSGVYNEDGIEAVGDYEVRSWLPHDEYDDLLSRNIVFLDLYDSSANNVIVECIRRNTPVMVNPLPAVREYLGDDYPFYFDSLEEAAVKILDRSYIREAYEYLAGLDKRELDGRYFYQSLRDSAVYRNLPAVNAHQVYPVSEAPPVDRLEDLDIIHGSPLSCRYVFIVCARNEENSIERCLGSILRQPEAHDYGIIFIDDDSSDASLAVGLDTLRDCSKPYVAVRNRERKYYSRNLYNAVHNLVIGDETVCVEVNGDDYLEDVNVLDILTDAYSTGVLKTFGDFRIVTGDEYSVRYASWKNEFDRGQIDYSQPWNVDVYPSWMHLRTYVRGLFLKVPNPYFWERNGRNWLIMNEDLSIHPKMAELAGHRALFIDEYLYVYDISHTHHDHRTEQWQTYTAENLYRKPQSYLVGNAYRTLRQKAIAGRVKQMDVTARAGLKKIS